MSTDDPRFNVLLADPPWQFGAHSGGTSRTSDSQYATMSTAQICALGDPLYDVTESRAALFLWCISSNVPEALRVGAQWGFEFVTVGFVWSKLLANPIQDHSLTAAIQATVRGSDQRPLITYNGQLYRQAFGMGHYTRTAAELCLLFKRGRFPVSDHAIEQVIQAPIREHSRKPDDIYARIESLYPDGKYLELFARQRRHRWAAWGNETDRFEAPQ